MKSNKSLLDKIKKLCRGFEEYEREEREKKDQEPIKLTEENVRRIIKEKIVLDYKNREISLEEFKIKMAQIDDYLDEFLDEFEMNGFERG